VRIRYVSWLWVIMIEVLYVFPQYLHLIAKIAPPKQPKPPPSWSCQLRLSLVTVW